jgi:hypothetical protein
MPRGDNPNSRANLKPARCGEVRNPSGINRKRPISDRYAELSEEPLSLNLIQRFNRRWKAKLLFPGDSYARGAVMGIMMDAIFGGDVAAQREMREAIEGKAPQRLEIGARPRTEVTVRVVYDRSPKNVEPTQHVMDHRQAERALSKLPGLPS